MNSASQSTQPMIFLRAGILAATVALAASGCTFPGPTGPTATPLPLDEPIGWVCYQNVTFGFEVCYPAASVFTTASDAHSRIDLAFLPGTNLVEKWMDVDSREGLADCVTPMADG